MLAADVGELARARARWDVCIVGAGPAGITLARTLGERGMSVALHDLGAGGIGSEPQLRQRLRLHVGWQLRVRAHGPGDLARSEVNLDSVTHFDSGVGIADTGVADDG